MTLKVCLLKSLRKFGAKVSKGALFKTLLIGKLSKYMLLAKREHVPTAMPAESKSLRMFHREGDPDNKDCDIVGMHPSHHCGHTWK